LVLAQQHAAGGVTNHLANAVEILLQVRPGGPLPAAEDVSHVVRLVRREAVSDGQHSSSPAHPKSQRPDARHRSNLEPCRRHVIQHEPKLVWCQGLSALGNHEEKLISVYS
jgi:hypothetical protein